MVSAFLLLLSCGRGAASEESVLLASKQVSFESVAGLGPHRMSSTLSWDRGAARGGKTTETLELVWGDWDHFQARRLRDDRLATEVRVVGGVAYTRAGKGRFRRARDAELYRVQLAGSWSYWERALEPFRGVHVSAADGDERVESRPARRFVLSMISLAGNADHSTHRPQSLSGSFVLDEATAVRLRGEMEGVYFEGGNEERPVAIELALERADFGVFPDLSPPSRARRPLLGEQPTRE
jgi:hypothetical protein